MQKFAGQGSNSSHRSNQSHSRDNTGSLTWRATRELLYSNFNYFLPSAYFGFHSLFVCFYFGCTWGIWKFPDQGLNPCHSCNMCHSWGNTRSLTHWAMRELPRSILVSYDSCLWPWLFQPFFSVYFISTSFYCYGLRLTDLQYLISCKSHLMYLSFHSFFCP